jgi:hypothetical protein
MSPVGKSMSRLHTVRMYCRQNAAMVHADLCCCLHRICGAEAPDAVLLPLTPRHQGCTHGGLHRPWSWHRAGGRRRRWRRACCCCSDGVVLTSGLGLHVAAGATEHGVHGAPEARPCQTPGADLVKGKQRLLWPVPTGRICAINCVPTNARRRHASKILHGHLLLLHISGVHPFSSGCDSGEMLYIAVV